MSNDDHAVYDESLRAAARSLGMELTASAIAQLGRHYEMVVEANRRFNLTRITEAAAFAVKHHADSLALLSWVGQGVSDAGGLSGRVQVLDVGTGAGLPAVPLAIVRPDWAVTAIDGTGKKARFVGECAVALGLANLSAVQARAEIWNPSGQFDIVAMKALGPLKRCLATSARHVRPGGFLVCYKTPELAADEIESGLGYSEKLGWPVAVRYDYELPLGDEVLRRTFWVFQSPGR